VVGIVGNTLDLLGAMYLAYDLLGGEHGPLRTLTRAVTYGTIFGAGYGIALGPVFGLVTGVAHGITLAWEYSRASRHEPDPGFWLDAAMSAIRACGFAVGATYVFGARFGVTFGVLSTVGQLLAYRIGIRPSLAYEPSVRPHLNRFLLLAAANRAVGYAIAGYLSSVVAGHREHAIAVGLRAGLVIGVVTALAGPLTPFIEWTADHMPARRMGAFGVGLILTGFLLQSVQYWIVLLDIVVR